jgi:CheY-like chemotaxis protein
LGGKIFFVSEEGNGTVFYVHLPKMGAVKPEETSVIIDEINKNIKKLKTLIVEDDLSSQALLKYILQEYSEQLIYASNGEEAVEMCKKYPDLDLIMMDIKMPVMDGLTATKEIRTFNKNVVVIAQTAFAMKGDEEKALNAGCNDFLTKPILKETLVGILKKWFNKDYFSD